MVNKALCGNGFAGLYILWVCQYLTSGMLFLVACVSSILYMQFESIKEGHKVGHSMLDEEDFDEYGQPYGDKAVGGEYEQGAVVLPDTAYDEPAASKYHHVEMTTQNEEPPPFD